jgi:UDP-glucose 4-epimerase
LENKKIIVTGGAGAIGINLVLELLRLGAREILILDNLSSGNISLIPSDERIMFRSVDIFRQDELTSIWNVFKPNIVFHLAAHFANQNSVEHPYSDIQTNILGTVNLLELSKNSPYLEKFIYASSSCVYGDSEVMKEDSFIYPFETPYAINKYTAELYVRYYSHLFNVPTISIRIFNTYGPFELPGQYRNVIPNFIAKALSDEDLTITGDGEETRDFTYMSDTVQLLILAAKSVVTNGDCFNGGAGVETKIIDLAKKIIFLSGSKSKIVFIERRNWDLVSRRFSVLDKSVNILKYSPKCSIDEGLGKTILWHKGLHV